MEIGTGLIALLTFVGALFAAYFGGKVKGKDEAKSETKVKQAQATAKAVQDRKELNNDIQDDTDLVARARGAGLVLPESKS